MSTTLKFIQHIRDFELKGKRVFIRVDFNVPLNGKKVEDANRIEEALPTIKFAIEKGAKIILASHLGRPKGKVDPQFSLEPCAHKLAELLNIDVTLAQDCVGEGVELMTKGLKNGQVLMLENLRYHAEEEKNDPTFCHELARLCDIYIDDAFGATHRKHASVFGLPSLVAQKGIGFLIEKELKALDPLLENPKRPFYALLGGSKVSDKIKTIESLMNVVTGIAIGGAMAFAFDAAEGKTVPANAKQPAPEDIEAARMVLKQARSKGLKIMLPTDTVNSFDIGKNSIAHFEGFLSDAKTVFWNGPLGWFEKPEYSEGTFALARFIGRLDAFKVVGGGDTVSAIKQSGEAARFDHLSTGGGAVLEYLEGKGLPGIDCLKGLPNRHADNAPKFTRGEDEVFDIRKAGKE